MLYEHSYVTNLETTAPQSDLTGAEKKNGPLILDKEREQSSYLQPRQLSTKSQIEREENNRKGRGWTKITPVPSGPRGKTENTAAVTLTNAVRKTSPRKTAATNRSRPQRTTTPHPRTRLARAPDYLDAHREQQLAITMYEPKNAEERRTEVPKQLRVPCTKQRRERA